MKLLRRYLFTVIYAGITVLCFGSTLCFYFLVVRSMYELSSIGKIIHIEDNIPNTINGTVSGKTISWFQWEYNDNTKDYPSRAGEPRLQTCTESTGLYIYTGVGGSLPSSPNQNFSANGGCYSFSVNDGCTQRTAHIGVQSINGDQRNFLLTITLDIRDGCDTAEIALFWIFIAAGGFIGVVTLFVTILSCVCVYCVGYGRQGYHSL